MALIVVSSAVPAALNRYYHDPAFARDDYRSIAAYVRAVADENDAVILTAPGQIDVFSQYDHGPAALHPLPRTRPLDAAATRAELDAVIAAGNRLYAIFWATEQADPEGVIESHLVGHSFKAWDSWVGNLRFVAYSAAPPPAATQFVVAPRFGDAITLDALGLSADAVQPGDIAQVLLRWTTTAAVPASYKVTLQLLDPANQVVAQVDSVPGGGARSTTSWQPLDLIDDAYGLPVPLATPPGDYALILALYDAESGVRLPVTTAERVDDALPLGSVRVQPPDSAPPLAVLPISYRAEVNVGSITFLGHDRYKQGFGHAPDTPLAPGDLLHLTTFWQLNAPVDGDWTFDVLLEGAPIGRFQLAGPGYPTSRWVAGLPWRGEHSVLLPADLAADGKQQIVLQLLDPGGNPTGDPIRLSPDILY